MSIRRSARRTNFTMLDNCVFAPGLSFRAVGLLAYLLSKPDHWEVSVAQLVKFSANSVRPDGRDSVYAILKELIGCGFVRRTMAREDGKLNGYDYEVFDTPQPLTSMPETDMQDTDEPYTAEPTQVKTDLKQTLKKQGNTESSSASVSVEAAFELFWKASLKNGSKKKAGSIFASICKRDKLVPMEFAVTLVNDTNTRIKAAQFGFDKLHGTTYLTQERWNDNVPVNDNTGQPHSNHHGLAGKSYGGDDNDAVQIGGL